MDRGAWWVIVSVQFSSVQLLSHVWLFAAPWTPARQASLSITNHQSPPKPMSITQWMMPSSHLILCHPRLLSLNLSQHQGLFKWVSSSHQVIVYGVANSQTQLSTHAHTYTEIKGSGWGQKKYNGFQSKCTPSWSLYCFCTLESFNTCIGAGAIELGHVR